MDLKKEFRINEFIFSTDKSLLDVKYVHQFLSERSYWAMGIPLDIVQRSIQNSVSIGIYAHEKQIGFARIITDLATFGYLADVFIDEAYRGKGLSKRLMEFIHSIEELKLLRRMMLGTRDAHGLYAQYGFKPLAMPDRFMDFHRPDVYKQAIL